MQVWAAVKKYNRRTQVAIKPTTSWLLDRHHTLDARDCPMATAGSIHSSITIQLHSLITIKVYCAWKVQLNLQATQLIRNQCNSFYSITLLNIPIIQSLWIKLDIQYTLKFLPGTWWALQTPVRCWWGGWRPAPSGSVPSPSCAPCAAAWEGASAPTASPTCLRVNYEPKGRAKIPCKRSLGDSTQRVTRFLILVLSIGLIS